MLNHSEHSTKFNYTDNNNKMTRIFNSNLDRSEPHQHATKTFAVLHTKTKYRIIQKKQFSRTQRVQNQYKSKKD